MKRISGFFVLLFLGIFLASCSKGKIGDISVSEYRIVEIKPETMRYIKCTVSLNVTNNGPAISFPKFEGELFRNEQKIGDFVLLEPLDIPGEGTDWTDLKAKLVVSPEISIFSLVRMMRNPDVSQFYVSFDTTVGLGALKVPVKRSRLPLSKLLKQEK